MSVDIFGRVLKEAKGVQGPPGIGFELTAEGHYNANYKKLRNLADPVQPNDAVNLNTLKRLIAAEFKTVRTALQKDSDDLKLALKNNLLDICEEIEKMAKVQDTLTQAVNVLRNTTN